MSMSKHFTIENGVLQKYLGKGRSVVIPEGVTKIGEAAFRECENVSATCCITIFEGRI